MNKKRLNYIICVSLLMFLFMGLFSSCDKIVSAVQEEFNSERAPKRETAVVIDFSENSSSSSPSLEGQKYKEIIYLIRGTAPSLSPIENSNNNYLLSMKIAENIIQFGGLADTQMNFIYDLVFINQWPQESFCIGGLILLKEDKKSLPADLILNVVATSPSYDISTKTLTFVLTPQGAMLEPFLQQGLNSLILLIKSQEQNF